MARITIQATTFPAMIELRQAAREAGLECEIELGLQRRDLPSRKELATLVFVAVLTTAVEKVVDLIFDAFEGKTATVIINREEIVVEKGQISRIIRRHVEHHSN